MEKTFDELREMYRSLEAVVSPQVEMDAYNNALPSFQKFFSNVSNRKVIEAAVKMQIVTTSKHSANKKKIIALRKVMNTFRNTPIKVRGDEEFYDRVMFCFFEGTTKDGKYPTRVWVEDVIDQTIEEMADKIVYLEDYDPYPLAAGIANYFLPNNVIRRRKCLDKLLGRE